MPDPGGWVPSHKIAPASAAPTSRRTKRRPAWKVGGGLHRVDAEEEDDDDIENDDEQSDTCRDVDPEAGVAGGGLCSDEVSRLNQGINLRGIDDGNDTGG